MEKRKCIFCGVPPPLTREHVIPSWLQKYVGGGEPSEFVGTRTSFIGMPLDERRASGGSYTLKSVCGTCNHGWMSQLETRFAALLPRLEADVNPKRFNKAERASIAKWIIKTGIVAHLSSNYRRILPDGFPLWLSRGQVIPGGIRVFGGTLEEKEQILWAQTNFTSITMPKSDFKSFDARRHTFVFTLQIRGIFIGFGWHGMDQRDFRIMLPDDQMHHIYPHPHSARSAKPYEDIRQPTMLVMLVPR